MEQFSVIAKELVPQSNYMIFRIICTNRARGCSLVSSPYVIIAL